MSPQERTGGEYFFSEDFKHALAFLPELQILVLFSEEPVCPSQSPLDCEQTDDEQSNGKESDGEEKSESDDEIDGEETDSDSALGSDSGSLSSTHGYPSSSSDWDHLELDYVRWLAPPKLQELYVFHASNEVYGQCTDGECWTSGREVSFGRLHMEWVVTCRDCPDGPFAQHSLDSPEYPTNVRNVILYDSI